jgi:hypothetical protein
MIASVKACWIRLPHTAVEAYETGETSLPLLNIPAAELSVQPVPIRAVKDEGRRAWDEVWGDSFGSVLQLVDWKDASRVLEYDCGEGFSSLHLCSRLAPQAQLIAVESNPYRADRARRRLEARYPSKTQVVVGDPVVQPVPPGPYDVIVWAFDRTMALLKSQIPTLAIPLGQEALLLKTLKVLRRWSGPRTKLLLWDRSWERSLFLPGSSQLQSLMDQLDQAQISHCQNSWSKWIERCNWVSQLQLAGFFSKSVLPQQRAGLPGSPLYRAIEKGLLHQAEEFVSAEFGGQLQRELDLRKLDPAATLFGPQSLAILASCDPA